MLTNLTIKLNKEIDLQPVSDTITTLHSIKSFPDSSIIKNLTLLYHDSKILFLCDLYLKNEKQLRVGTMACCDPQNGNFTTINNGSDILCIGCFGNSIIGLKKQKQFLLLVDYTWIFSLIPPLPGGDLRNPLILTYQSFLFVVDGSVMWVHADSICDWMKFELLSAKDAPVASSPVNSYVVLVGKLFVCSATQKTVYYIDIKQIFDVILENSSSEATNQLSDDQKQGKESTPLVESKGSHTLMLTQTLKGAHYIFAHNDYLFALSTTQTTRMSSYYIDRAWYYDVRCCHWHDIECTTPDITKGCWLSMSGHASIFEFASTWRGWGHVKLYTVTTSSN